MIRDNEKHIAKEKVTLTLSPRFLKEVDRWSKEEKIKSRSAAIERLIEQWLLEKERKRLEAETEAYYLSLTPAEKEEDKEWVSLSSDQADHRFEN